MPRIRCFYDDCIYLLKGLCNAPTIELDPDDGCLTFNDDPEDISSPVIPAEDMDDYEEDSWEEEGYEELSDLDIEEDF